jgi:hypothetical protein
MYFIGFYDDTTRGGDAYFVSLENTVSSFVRNLLAIHIGSFVDRFTPIYAGWK